LFAQAAPALPPLPALAVDLPADMPLPAAVLDAVAQGTATLSSDGPRQRVQLRGTVPVAVREALVAAHKGRQREQVAQQIERHNALVASALAPVNRGQTFVPVPRLCYRAAQGELVLLEREAVLETVSLNLLAEPVRLEGLTMAEQGTLWDVYLDGKKPRVGRGDATQLALSSVTSTIGVKVAGFWPPTSFGRFYSDFVCQLTDGRVAVVEYKGEHLRTVPKEIEKGAGRGGLGRAQPRPRRLRDVLPIRARHVDDGADQRRTGVGSTVATRKNAARARPATAAPPAGSGPNVPATPPWPPR
jgi:hypothetical protein